MMNKQDVVNDYKVEDDYEIPGFRFHPTDEELLGFYLRRKVEKRQTDLDLIKEIDINKFDPWDLPKKSSTEDKEWYFFCERGRKYRNSIRPNRVTGSGFWKATGIDKPVYSTSPGQGHHCIGLKKTLVYHRGTMGKGSKTDWMMNEFRLPPTNLNTNSKTTLQEQQVVWTICHIFKRNVYTAKNNEMHIIQVGPGILDPGASCSSQMTPTVSSHQRKIDEFRLSGLASTFLQVAAQGGLATVAVQYGSGKSLAGNARTLLSLAELCSAAGFIACSGGYILECRGRAEQVAQLMTGVGGVATACGFISMMGILLPENLMLWITFLICMITIFAFSVAFLIKR